MGEGLRFGIQTIQSRPWPEMVDLWRGFEERGFDSLWLPDHFVRPFPPPAPMFDAWMVLAALATVTARARLGVLVSCNTFRHPALLAKQAVTVDHVSGGRLEIGLGAGWYEREHTQFGLDYPETAERVARFAEAVEVVDALLRHDVTTYDGRYYRLREAPFRPRPVKRPRPPLTLGAHGPKMLGIVARHADRWNSIGTIDEIRERNARLDEACLAAGRDPGAIIRSLLYVPALVAATPWASVDAFQEFVGRYREVGINEFLFQPPAAEAMPVVDRVAAEVIPALRAAGGR